MLKRIIDIGGALFGLVFAAPVICLAVVLVRISSPGPSIFKQVRIGQNGAPFTCYKLRTMYTGSANVPTHEISATQISPVGSFMRRTKLDELPQLWNVIRGEMSFVGPRPCLPSQTALIEERSKRGVLTLKPGITGLAQIRDIDMSDPVRLAEADAEYLRAASVLLDLRIIFRTVFKGAGSGDRVRT